jgi:hypothetical protein
MPSKYKRYLKKEIAKQKVDLPEELTFLAKSDYFAIAEQKADGNRKWHVEIQGTVLKRLIDAKSKFNARR